MKSVIWRGGWGRHRGGRWAGRSGGLAGGCMHACRGGVLARQPPTVRARAAHLRQARLFKGAQLQHRLAIAQRRGLLDAAGLAVVGERAVLDDLGQQLAVTAGGEAREAVREAVGRAQAV